MHLYFPITFHSNDISETNMHSNKIPLETFIGY